MDITSEQLNLIIQEELEAVLDEKRKKKRKKRKSRKRKKKKYTKIKNRK